MYVADEWRKRVRWMARRSDAGSRCKVLGRSILTLRSVLSHSPHLRVFCFYHTHRMGSHTPATSNRSNPLHRHSAVRQPASEFVSKTTNKLARSSPSSIVNSSQSVTQSIGRDTVSLRQRLCWIELFYCDDAGYWVSERLTDWVGFVLMQSVAFSKFHP